MTDLELRQVKEKLISFSTQIEWSLLEDKNGVLVFSDKKGLQLQKISSHLPLPSKFRYRKRWLFAIIGLFLVYMSVDRIKYLSSTIYLKQVAIKRILKLAALLVLCKISLDKYWHV